MHVFALHWPVQSGTHPPEFNHQTCRVAHQALSQPSFCLGMFSQEDSLAGGRKLHIPGLIWWDRRYVPNLKLQFTHPYLEKKKLSYDACILHWWDGSPDIAHPTTPPIFNSHPMAQIIWSYLNCYSKTAYLYVS